MFDLFAHGSTGTHIMESGREMSDLDHCAPIVIGATIVVAILVVIIIYFLVAWQPKPRASEQEAAKPTVKKD